MKKKCQISSFIATSVLIAGCSHFTTSTNVDRSNFEEYFSSSNVAIFKSEKDFKGDYKYMGLVEGDDCQQKLHHAKPDEVIARTHARKNADKIKANAIVFTGCALIDNDESSKQCIATTVCYGKAYYIKP